MWNINKTNDIKGETGIRKGKIIILRDELSFSETKESHHLFSKKKGSDTVSRMTSR